ncbi:MAG: polysaccharide deacetylase family protein, partial [Chloroflexota bacterium]
LIVNTGDAQEISVLDENGSAIPYQEGPEENDIIFSTSGETVRINFSTVTPEFPLGVVRKANLKDGYKWAYSHGFDDNYGLDATRNVFLERDVPATYNVVADWVEVIPGWAGDFTPDELNEIIAAGWGINNHTWDHETADDPNANGCSDTLTREERKADILATQERLEQLIVNSPRPDYFIIGFSIPCGGFEQVRDYPGIIHEIRDNEEAPLQFYEVGFELPIYMDVTTPFDFDRAILRDGRIDGSNGQVEQVKAEFDTISGLAQTTGTAYWYNTFSHGDILFGDNTVLMAETLDYLLQNYGRDGSNEVWIAPSDEIYSYLLVRDNSVVTFESTDGTPFPTPTPSIGCEDLLNPAFELGLENWSEGGNLEIVDGRTGNAISITNGFTTQEIQAQPNIAFTLSGYFKIEELDTASTERWVGFGIDYLGEDGVEVGEGSFEIDAEQPDFARFEVKGTTRSTTSLVRVWLFSTNTTPLLVDDLSLEWESCLSAPATATPAPPTPTLTPQPTVEVTETPEATPTIGQNPPTDFDFFQFLPAIVR